MVPDSCTSEPTTLGRPKGEVPGWSLLGSRRAAVGAPRGQAAEQATPTLRQILVVELLAFQGTGEGELSHEAAWETRVCSPTC